MWCTHYSSKKRLPYMHDDNTHTSQKSTTRPHRHIFSPPRRHDCEQSNHPPPNCDLTPTQNDGSGPGPKQDDDESDANEPQSARRYGRRDRPRRRRSSRRDCRAEQPSSDEGLTREETARRQLHLALEGRDPNRVAEHIKMLSERDVADLAATSSAVEAVVNNPLTKRGQDEDPTPPEVAPVDWLRVVLYICLEGRGRPVRVHSAAIYDHTGSSIRKAGITTLKTTVMAIRPGRYNPKTNRRRQTEYTPDTIAVQATVDWLDWHDDRDRRPQGRVRASGAAEILSEVSPNLADDAFLDCLRALSETLNLNTEELTDAAVGDRRLTYNLSISAVYDKMRDRHAEAVRDRGGILNIDISLFTVKRYVGGHQLTVTRPEEMARVLEAVALAQHRLDAEQPFGEQPSLFDRLQVGLASTDSSSVYRNRSLGDGGDGDQADGECLNKPEPNKTTAPHTTEDPHTAQGPDEEPEPTTTTHTPKDSECSSNSSQKRGLDRSDPSSATFAVGRKAGPNALFERDGIHFSDTWTVCSSQAQMIEQATRGLSDAAHHFFVHAVRSSAAQQKRSDGWFPFYYKHIRQTLPVSPEEHDRTAMVWRPLVERSLITYRKHSSQDNRVREFQVDPEWLRRFLERRFDEDNESDTKESGVPSVDAFTGQCKPLKKQQTRLYDSNRKQYNGSLLKGLQVLKDATKQFDKAAVETHLVRQKREVEAARLKVRRKTTVDFNRHVRAYFYTSDAELKEHGWPTNVSLAHWKRIYPGPHYTSAYLTHRRLQKAYLNDLRCYAAIIRQRPRHVWGNIWAYDTAWRVQAISGRVSEKGGALQSCSREMKAAAFARLEGAGRLYNYDLSSSQLRDIIEATERVSTVDTALLRSRYLNTSKQANADTLGISRDAYKSLLYMTGFMGGWKATLENALRQAFQTIPEAVRIVRRAVREDGGDADTVYQAASEHFRPLKQAVRALADDLLGAYWDANKYNAGGYVMRNACARPFRKSDYIRTDADGATQTDDDGAPKYDRHEMRKRVLAWYLQGNEADKMHRLAARCAEEGIPVMGNEHDGLITGAPIPEALQQEVLPESPLEINRFADYLREDEPPTDAELTRLRNDLNQWMGSDDAVI